MKILGLLYKFATLAAVLAQDNSRFGTLHITKIMNRSFLANLGIINHRLMAIEKMSVFSHEANSLLLHTSSNKYLQVRDDGYIVVTNVPHPGFLVGNRNGLFGMSAVSYKGDEVFQICGDGLIAYQSNCSNARNITLAFDDFF